MDEREAELRDILEEANRQLDSRQPRDDARAALKLVRRLVHLILHNEPLDS